MHARSRALARLSERDLHDMGVRRSDVYARAEPAVLARPPPADAVLTRRAALATSCRARTGLTSHRRQIAEDCRDEHDLPTF